MHLDTRDRFRRLTIALAILGFAPVPAPAGAGVPRVAAGVCMSLQASTLEILHVAEAKQQAGSSQRASQPERLPITERELDQLLDAFEPVALAGEGDRLQSFGQRSSLPPGRMQMLLEDITAHLVLIHLEEQIEHIQDLPELPPARIEWGESILASLDECLDRRYEPYGGANARQLAHHMIVANRPALEAGVYRRVIEYERMRRRPPE